MWGENRAQRFFGRKITALWAGKFFHLRESLSLECARGNSLSRVLTQQGLELMFGLALQDPGAFRFTARCELSYTWRVVQAKSEPPLHPLPSPLAPGLPQPPPSPAGSLKAFPSAETLHFGDWWSRFDIFHSACQGHLQSASECYVGLRRHFEVFAVEATCAGKDVTPPHPRGSCSALSSVM